MTRNLLLAATILAPFAALPELASAQPVTGIYIAGAGGANFLQQEKILSARVGFKTGYAALGSVGYGFGNGLRVEVEGNYRNNDFGAQRGNSGHEDKYGGMANVLFDLDIGSPYIFPYIGGGLGYSDVHQTQSVRAGTVTANLNGTSGSFAYQAIAGLSFPIPPVVGLSLTAEYRYFALAGTRNFDQTFQVAGSGPIGGRFSTKDNYNHSLLIGLRYAFNVPPPPAEAPPPAPPPASAEAAHTYLVFFDWDRADLSERARQIIAEAARASTDLKTTRLVVSGHTDTTGTARYNQGLSVRRAQTVAAELVRDGVPQAAITTQGFGFSKPLVTTGANVREPQNRRVEIVLQ